MSPRLDAEEERDLAEALSALHDADDEHANRDAQFSAEVDRLIRGDSPEQPDDLRAALDAILARTAGD
jgi:hypothetical protein